MTDNSIRKSIYLKAGKEEVWAFLTDPEKLAAWFHKPEKTLVEGEDYAMFGVESGKRLIWGKVIAAKPCDYLEYTFTIAPMGEAVSTVKWTLEDVTGGTRLLLEHIGLPEDGAALDLVLSLDKGWDGHLMKLRDSSQVAI